MIWPALKWLQHDNMFAIAQGHTTHEPIVHAPFRGPKAFHNLDICTLGKHFTICSLRSAHSTKARSQCTCAASNSFGLVRSAKGGGLEQGMILVGSHRRVVAVQAAELHAHAL